jgi:hypothetical protein
VHHTDAEAGLCPISKKIVSIVLLINKRNDNATPTKYVNFIDFICLESYIDISSTHVNFLVCYA